MSEELILLHLFDLQFTREQRAATQVQFERLALAYPNKPAVELWLTAIADIRDGASPWVH